MTDATVRRRHLDERDLQVVQRRDRLAIASFNQRRRSVTTWSLRERAVCRRPAAGPAICVRRASTFMWTSSRRSLNSKLPVLDLVADLQEAVEDLLGVLGRDDALVREHAGVRHRAAHVLQGDAPVDGQRRRVGLDSGFVASTKRPPQGLASSSPLRFFVRSAISAPPSSGPSRRIESCAHVSDGVIDGARSR